MQMRWGGRATVLARLTAHNLLTRVVSTADLLCDLICLGCCVLGPCPLLRSSAYWM